METGAPGGRAGRCCDSSEEGIVPLVDMLIIGSLALALIMIIAIVTME